MTLCLCSIALGSALLWAGPPSPATEGPRTAPGISVEFNRDIRPILSDHCYQCHGPDSARRKAGLRLDQEASAKAARDGRHAIVAGDLAASELYRRITSSDDDERMPPVKSGKILTKPQLELIGRWIAAGRNGKRTGRSSRPPARRSPPSSDRTGPGTRSIPSSWRGSSARAWSRAPRQCVESCYGE